jgi:hypothetical protein
MTYTRKQQGKKTKKSRNNRNHNYKKNNKKYGGVVPAVTISTATKAGLFGKKAITAVKVGSKLSKGNLSNLGVGIIDDALLHSSHYLFGKKGKKNKKQKGGDGGAIEALKTTLETADKIPGITFIPAYKIFSGLKYKLFDLLNVVKNEKILNVLNSKEMTAEEIKKQIKIIIGGDENIKNEIDKFKDVCSNLDKITSLPIIGKQLDKAIPHREELCMAFTEFNDNENIENTEEKTNNVLEYNTTEIENPKETTDDIIEKNTTEIENPKETTDDVLENNDIIENPKEITTNVLKNNDNIENPKETTDDVLENNDNIENPKEITTNVLENNDNIENPKEITTNVLNETTNIQEKDNCIKTSGFVKSITGATEFCYPSKKGGSRKSHKSNRKGSRKSRKSHKKKINSTL